MNLGQVRVVDPILSNVLLGYGDPDFVGFNLFPQVPVALSGGRIIQFGKEHFMAYSTQRAPGTPAKRITFGYLGAPYTLENHALEALVPREHMRDAALQPGIDLAVRAIKIVQKVNLRSVEIQQAGIATNQANYAAGAKVTLAGATKWSNPAATPKVDIDLARETIRATVGTYPNVMLLSAVAFNALRNNPSVIARFQYVSTESITAEMLAKLFDIDRVVVGRAIQSTDAGVMTDIWGNFAVLAVAPMKALGAEEPSYGYTYTMEGHPMVESPYWAEDIKSWVYGIGYERVPVLSGIGSAYLIIAPN